MSSFVERLAAGAVGLRVGDAPKVRPALTPEMIPQPLRAPQDARGPQRTPSSAVERGRVPHPEAPPQQSRSVTKTPKPPTAPEELPVKRPLKEEQGELAPPRESLKRAPAEVPPEGRPARTFIQLPKRTSIPSEVERVGEVDLEERSKEPAGPDAGETTVALPRHEASERPNLEAERYPTLEDRQTEETSGDVPEGESNEHASRGMERPSSEPEIAPPTLELGEPVESGVAATPPSPGRLQSLPDSPKSSRDDASADEPRGPEPAQETGEFETITGEQASETRSVTEPWSPTQPSTSARDIRTHEPSITINIGRIEVRAVNPERPAEDDRAPKLSLEEYMKRRRDRER